MAGAEAVPAWVDNLVQEIVSRHVVYAGPARTVVIGHLGEERGEARWLLRSAAEMSESVFGDTSLQIAGPHRGAILSRLHKLGRRVEGVACHPHTTSGEVWHNKEQGGWVHTTADGTLTVLTRDGHNYLVNSHKISNWKATTRLGLSAAAGIWQQVVGVLVDGQPAYGLVRDDPLALVIPCSPGGEVNVIMVIEMQEGLDVLGFRMRRPLQARGDVRPFFSPYDGGSGQSYFALWNHERGKRRLRVLRIPDN
jgi:hypothetical protein